MPIEQFDLSQYHFRLRSADYNIDTDITNIINIHN